MEKALPLIKSARTILRLADRDDVSAIVRYYIENRSHLAPFEPLKTSDFYTENYWYNELKERFNDFTTDRSVELFLFKRENPRAIVGAVNFTNFVGGAFQCCTLGYSLAEIEQGNGYMTEALKVAIRYVFSEWNLHRITAAYLPHNVPSARLLKRLGFVVEGYAYDYLLINGQWQDHILTSLINRNWKQNQGL